MKKGIIEINLSALGENYHSIERILQKETEIMAVVKANAYGHGSCEISKYLVGLGCKNLAVATLSEAIELRKFGINATILILSMTDIEFAKLLEYYNLTQTVSTLEYAQQLSESGYSFNVHIKIDTGLSRFGFYCHRSSDIIECTNTIKNIQSFHNLKVRGIYTHFADSAMDDSFTNIQFNLFSDLISKLENNGFHFDYKHCCNSAATLRYPKMHMNMVRCGISLYGYPQTFSLEKFCPIMTIKSYLIEIKRIHPLDSVSYARKFVAKGTMEIGVVNIGYADGYSRKLSNSDYFIWNGFKLPVIGVVAMDVCMVDLTLCKNIKVGDSVVILDHTKNAEFIANQIDTIVYEVLCGVGNRFTRIYFD